MKPYFQDETVTLYCADNRDVLSDIGAVDLVLTDPPYGIAAGVVADRPTKWQRRAGQTTETWDDSTLPETVLGLLTMAEKVVVWGGNYYPLPPSRCWLAWYKPDAPPSMADVELAWTSLDQNARHISHSISATNAERVGHPTQKPVRVMRWSVEQCRVLPGAVILDPFMGSGTTGVVAAIDGYRFIGCDISEQYCELAKARILRAKGTPYDVPRLGTLHIETPLFG
jgi:site-specific DNA-methyltransferase (adenine-specific)